MPGLKRIELGTEHRLLGIIQIQVDIQLIADPGRAVVVGQLQRAATRQPHPHQNNYPLSHLIHMILFEYSFRRSLIFSKGALHSAKFHHRQE